MPWGKDVPNPGSEEARAASCICPVLDNNYGWGSDWGKDRFWITEECPLHGKESDE